MPVDSIQFDDIAKIFEQRDKRLAEKQQRQRKLEASSSSRSRAVRSSDAVHKKVSGEPGRIINLEYSPAKDEYAPPRRRSTKTVQTRKAGSGNSTQASKEHSRSRRLKSKPKRMNPVMKSILGVGSAIALGVSAYGATKNFSNSDGDMLSITTIEPVTIESVNSSSNAESDNDSIGDAIVLDGGEYEVEFSQDGGVAINELRPATSANTEDETIALSLDERLEQIFADDPEAEIAFNDIEKTLERITDAIGEDSVEFIRKTRDTYALNAPLSMLICIFEQESGGRMWNSDGTLLVGSSNDTGIGQITPKCEDDVNGRLNPDGIIRRKENPRDNIEIAAISLQDHCKVWGFDINNGDYEENTEAMKYVLSAYNAGDANVRKYGLRERYVKECFEEHLSYMLKYPEFQEYFGCEDFID